MDMENIIIKMELFTKVNGRKIFKMEMGLNSFQMVQLIKGNF